MLKNDTHVFRATTPGKVGLMIKRPAFVDGLLDRYRALFGLGAQLQLRVGVLVVGFALAFVLAAVHLDDRRQAESRRGAARSLATTAGVWLDGDAHAGLGEDPEKRLGEVGDALGRVLETAGFEGVVRTLRPLPEAKTALMAAPDAARPNALEVVVSRGGEKTDGTLAYRPEMAPVFVDGQPVSIVENGRVLAWAPVQDSWGATVAAVAVECSAHATLWRRIAFLAAALVVAGLLATGGLWLARRFGRRVSSSLELLTACVHDLAQGRTGAPIGVESSPREIEALAEALEGLRQTLDQRAPHRPQAATAAPAAWNSAPAPAPAHGARPAVASTEAHAEFDLALLVHQLVEPIKQRVKMRGVETQVVCPDGVPTRLVGPAQTLHRTLAALLGHAARVVESGRITVRVTRAGIEAGQVRLRFEVADTGPGIAFDRQQELKARLDEAPDVDPAATEDLLVRAGALAARLGGELGFETQPGQGSRFGFAASFPVVGPIPATGFQPRAAVLNGAL